jgi:hypothetical protein
MTTDEEFEETLRLANDLVIYTLRATQLDSERVNAVAQMLISNVGLALGGFYAFSGWSQDDVTRAKDDAAENVRIDIQEKYESAMAAQEAAATPTKH